LRPLRHIAKFNDMQKIISLSIILLLANYSQSTAQNIGIGTTSPQQKLHIAGGLRVDTLANGTDSGLLRHNALGTVYTLHFTGDSTQMLRGNGTFGPSGYGTGWNLTGNAGTNPASSFIGTTDNNPLLFRINNQFAGKLDSVSGTSLFGYGAGQNITLAFNNTAIGAWALNADTKGSSNAAVGYEALYRNTLGYENAAFGSGALSNNTTGFDNTAVGMAALEANTSGIDNVALGAHALFSNNTGSNNMGLGYNALYSNSTGSGNTVVGHVAMSANTTGSYNTAAGFQALENSTTGSNNVAMGNAALFANTTGSQHVAVGASALTNTTATYPNTAVGYYAGASITTGSANTAIGTNSMQNTTTGLNNTAVGNNTLQTLTTGSSNTVIGNNADMASGSLSNATAIGADAVVNASNKVRIGSSSVTVIEGQVPFTIPSDGRYKFNIREDVKGLDFILRLRPVTYQFDVQRFDQVIQASYPRERIVRTSYDEALALRRTGFIAQEVEKAATESDYDFSGINRPKTDNDHYSLSYESFVVPLVKAVQEQQQTIETLNKRIDRQQRQIDELLRRLDAQSGNTGK
jgi:hypothetical protein